MTRAGLIHAPSSDWSSALAAALGPTAEHGNRKAQAFGRELSTPSADSYSVVSVPVGGYIFQVSDLVGVRRHTHGFKPGARQ